MARPEADDSLPLIHATEVVRLHTPFGVAALPRPRRTWFPVLVAVVVATTASFAAVSVLSTTLLHQLEALIPEATPAVAPAPVATRSYTVRSGDTLSLIAKRELGDAAAYPALIDLNRGVIGDPEVLEVGVVLRIPTD